MRDAYSMRLAAYSWGDRSTPCIGNTPGTVHAAGILACDSSTSTGSRYTKDKPRRSDARMRNGALDQHLRRCLPANQPRRRLPEHAFQAIREKGIDQAELAEIAPLHHQAVAGGIEAERNLSVEIRRT